MQVAGNIALVAGGGSGLGAATARHLAEQIIENPFLSGTTIRQDGAVRLPPR